MGFKGEEATAGAAPADTIKIRAEREQELLGLVRTSAGREIIECHFAKYTGIALDRCPPAGLLMIQTILQHEYRIT